MKTISSGNWSEKVINYYSHSPCPCLKYISSPNVHAIRQFVAHDGPRGLHVGVNATAMTQADKAKTNKDMLQHV